MNISGDALLQGAFSYAVPLWLAGLGELIVQRAGVVNIGIEGMMLAGALAAWAVAATTGSAWAGVAAAAGAGLVLAALFAAVVLLFDADQVVAGTAVNLLAVGATGMGFKLCLEAGLAERYGVFFAPLSWEALPFEALNQFWPFFAAIILAAVMHVVLSRTVLGVEVKALGESPEAADAAGLHVRGWRLACILFGGLTAGVAGSYLSIMFNTQFNENMTAGRGFLALAMVIFGRWQPLGVIAAGLFFGVVYWVGKLMEISAAGSGLVPLMDMSPYVLSLVVLAGWVGRTRAPAALGQPLERN